MVLFYQQYQILFFYTCWYIVEWKLFTKDANIIVIATLCSSQYLSDCRLCICFKPCLTVDCVYALSLKVTLFPALAGKKPKIFTILGDSIPEYLYLLKNQCTYNLLIVKLWSHILPDHHSKFRSMLAIC